MVALICAGACGVTVFLAINVFRKTLIGSIKELITSNISNKNESIMALVRFDEIR